MRDIAGKYKIAVVAHCFYQDMVQGLADMLSNIPSPLDVYVSTPRGMSRRTEDVFKSVLPRARVTVREVENRGYDIAPFICDFSQSLLLYDLVLKVHTKKTPHVPWLKGWGNYLMYNLSGSEEIVRNILGMFDGDEKLGVVYPEIVPHLFTELEKDPWQENRQAVEKLCSRMNMDAFGVPLLDFPAGSMFWFRPEALRPVFSLGIEREEFPCGRRVRRNGTIAHALERLFCAAAVKNGFRSRKVAFCKFRTIRDNSLMGRLYDRIISDCHKLLDLAGFGPR